MCLEWYGCMWLQYPGTSFVQSAALSPTLSRWGNAVILRRRLEDRQNGLSMRRQQAVGDRPFVKEQAILLFVLYACIPQRKKVTVIVDHCCWKQADITTDQLLA